MAVSRRLRFEILKRDDYTCCYCGASPKNTADVALQVDHVIAVTLGGGDDPSNLATACQPCNAGKSSVPADAPLVEQVASDALRWARAMTLASQMGEDETAALEEAQEEWRIIWDEWTFGPTTDRQCIPVADGWRESLDGFYVAGLTFGEMARLIPRAMRSKASPEETFRYYCGCCWKSVANLQETARQLIEDGVVDGEN